MNSRFAKSGIRHGLRSRRRQKVREYRLLFELLEDRTMLSGPSQLPPAIVIGRTLATPSTANAAVPSPSYFVGEVENNQVTITFSVYNQQLDPVTGVLVTDTLSAGVSMASASQQPDQSGRDLAWNLGTIQGYGRVSVSITVNVPTPASLQLDTGASAYAMLDGDAVSASTPAAALQPGNVSDPSLLASTVDADTNDPYIQEQAAALDYDPTQIFNFLHTQIGYNSYFGSVRGARGTLWSDAGDSLDVASLGVALMRASGIPAQYVSGTLSQSDAQQLILSMFPAQYQTVGYIPSGTQISDPANDPQLLAETEAHYWFQFLKGGVMTDADPLLAGATIGQTFTTSTGTFAVVPQNLEETTEVQLVAEMYNQASALFGLSSGLQDTTVLDQTFDDDQLVGRPLTIGNFVTQSGGSALFTAVTNTYTPYVEIGDEANPNPSQNEVIQGTPYQEFLTNFPLGGQVLTGLFLNMTLSGPNGVSETDQRTLFDRLGPAIRQNGGTPNISINPTGPPALTNQDVFTLYAASGLNAPAFPGQYPTALAALGQQISQEQASTSSPTSEDESLLTSDVTALTSAIGAAVLTDSDATTSRLASDSLVIAYSVRPRLILVSNMVVYAANSQTGSAVISIDLRRDTLRVLSFPGQSASTAIAFAALRGVSEGLVEQQVSAMLVPPTQPPSTAVSAVDVFQAALAQGVGLILLTTENLSILNSMDISANAKTLITAAVDQGNSVIVPAQSITLNGASTTAWYQVDPETGEAIAVTEDGGHQNLNEYAAIFAFVGLLLVGTYFALAPVLTSFGNWISAKLQGKSLSPFLADIQNSLSTESTADVAGLPELGNQFTSLLEQAINLPLPGDPNVTSLSSPEPKQPIGFNDPDADITYPAGLSAGNVSASVETSGVSASGQLVASWSGTDTASFLVNTLNAAAATVLGPNGQTIGTGQVELTASSMPITVGGNTSYVVTGQGSLSAYPSAAIGPAVSADWQNYAATLSGSVTLTVTSASLTLNGATLPAGTYTITSSSAALAGSGTSASPNFAQSVSIAATNGTVYLGSGTGSISVAGSPLSAASGTTLTGYTGTLALTFGSSSLSAVLSGSATNVLAIAGTPATLTTDQNHSVSFQYDVLTSQADSYHTDVIAPGGWIAAIAQNGLVTLTPPPGLQGGTYAIELKASLLSAPEFVARAYVDVTITPTSPGITFNVAPDTKLAVPFGGASLPTAFTAAIQNLGPATDTYNLTFSNIPTGFTIVDSGANVTVPAGETGIVGVYLVPNAGQPLPSPGTQLPFDVTATSTTDTSITQTHNETFTVPEIDAVTLSAAPTSVSTIPGGSVTDKITITNAGNVAESNITLTDTLPSGLALTGLAPVSLAAGQSTTETITLTPAASTPLNSTLDTTFTATFGPQTSPSTQSLTITVGVAVPGAAAIANASVAAAQLGNADLADQLSDLSTALTALVENPASAVDQGQALASLTAVNGLLSADRFLASLVPALTAAGATLAQATTATAVQAAVSALGSDLTSVGTTLAAEAASGFTFGFVLGSSAIAQPEAPTTFQLQLQNTGSQTTTYDLSLSGLPAGVTGSLSQSSITLAAGQGTPGSSSVPTLIVTITSTSTTALAPFTFIVTATAQGAAEITASIDGSLTARTALVQVISVTPNPTFTNPGGQVDVSARILNAVNQQQQAQVSYTVTDSSDNVLFTSTPVSTTLNVLTTLSTVDLGNLDTTGFALGDDTITVTVSDASGNPIPGAMGTGTLLIGTPVTATLTTSTDLLPAGDGTVTETLQVGLNPETSGSSNLVGQVQPSNGASTVASYGTYAYVGGTSGISIVDMSNPANPTVVKTFGASDLASGYMAYVTVSGNDLYVNSSNPDGNPVSSLLIYSLADPLNPQLLGQTPLGNYYLFRGVTPYVDTADQHAYLNSFWIRYYLSSGAIFEQHGQINSINVSDPTNPTADGVVYNLPPSDYTDGDSNVWQESAVNADTLLAASTTNTGSTLDGTGEVMVVNTTDPSNPSLASTLQVPGTVAIIGVAQESGNRAVALGTTGYWSPAPGLSLTGDLVLTTLDVTDPTNPTIVATVPLNLPSVTAGALVSLGSDRFMTVSYNPSTSQESVVIIDATDPSNPIVSTFAVPAVINGATVSGNLLYTTSSSGLLVYNLNASTGTTPVTAQVTIPTGNGVSIVPGSFSIAPSNTVTGTGTETLEWDFELGSGDTSQTITWQEGVTGLAAGQSLPVVQGATVEFATSPLDTLTLPGQLVTGEQVIGLSPATQTVAPGAPAPFTVNLANPTNSAVTYTLSVQGVPSGWVGLPSSVAVAANSSTSVPLTLTSDSFAAVGDQGFTVTAVGSDGASGTVVGDLILQGTAVAPDSQSHGVVAALTSAEITAGQGTSALDQLTITNVGSAGDSYNLSVSGLPQGITATLSPTIIEVPPGTSNFKNVYLVLTPQVGTPPRTYPFSVTATSSSDPSVSSTTSGILTVTASGVQVTLNPGSGAPGSSFRATVTNTGTTTGTFNLALAGMAAAVSSLGTTQVTLAPGASQIVPITTGAVDFAIQGSLPLDATATLTTNPAILSVASSSLTIAASQGMTAEFSPATQTLSSPGMVTFTLIVQNTGNTADSYSATITGANGPITATLIGLDGSPTQSIPVFQMPALSSAAIELEVSAAQLGQGAVTVLVQSLSNPATRASVTATVVTGVIESTDGPRVMEVQRFGYHAMPTKLVLTFDQALDAATADDPRNFEIIGPRGRRIRVKSAVYDPANDTVTLRPSERINVHYKYELIVDGSKLSGVANTQGKLLDGKSTGHPGSNYRTALTWRNLVLPTAAGRALHKSRTAIKGDFRGVNRHGSTVDPRQGQST